MKRLWLALMLILALLPVAALADGITYLDYDPATKTLVSRSVSEYTVVDAGTTTLSTGWYVVNSKIRHANRITVSGDVHLILCDNAFLYSSWGITLTEGNTLTVYAQSTETKMGMLSVKAIDDGNAAIGGLANDSGNAHCGALVVNGGSIAADCSISKFSTAIGGGYSADGQGGNGGSITVNGGSVEVWGGEYGTGIGGGCGGRFDGMVNQTGQGGDGGTVTVNGGFVVARGGEYGAGIGGGGSENGKCGNGGSVIVNGGSVEARGGNGGAGIGGGCGLLKGQGGDGANVTLHGGKVMVWGGNGGAGIGGGYSENGKGGDGGTVTIDGGELTVSCDGCGIGGGYASGYGKGGDGGSLSVSGGKVTVTNYRTNFVCIGGSNSRYGNGGDGADICISGGEVSVTSTTGYSTIGGGNSERGSGGNGGSLTVTGGSLTALTYLSPSIGRGKPRSEGIAGTTVNLSGGTVSLGLVQWQGATGSAFDSADVLNFMPTPADGGNVNAIRVRRSSDAADVLQMYSTERLDVMRTNDVDRALYTQVGDSEAVSLFFDTVSCKPVSISIALGSQTFDLDKGAWDFEFSSSAVPDPTAFTVLYRPAGGGVSDWTSTKPTKAGTYDIRIQLPPKDGYALVDEVFPGALVLLKRENIQITVNAQQWYVGEAPAGGFSFGFTPDSLTRDGFTVEYRPAGSGDSAWTKTVPNAAGSYDVRISHPEDDDCFSFSAVHTDCLTVLDFLPLSIDTTPQVYAAGTPGIAFLVKPTPDTLAPASFTVAYRPAGGSASSWTTDAPFAPGTYDVRVTRPADGAIAMRAAQSTRYGALDCVIPGGLTIKSVEIDLPQTGDRSNIAIWLALAAACACALALILRARKR